MKINYSDHSNYKMFNPITGDVIVEWECDDDATSLIAYWVDECFNEPVIKDEVLKESWETYVEKFENENEDTPFFEELETFIKDYETSVWIAHKITTCGMACGPVSNTVLFVVDKDIIVEEFNEDEIENESEERNTDDLG